METSTPHFIVLGAGVSGICSAIDLAEAGYAVTLVEKGPRTGGILPQLDHQFPDDHCGMCRMLPMLDRDAGEQTCLKRGLMHQRIRVLTQTTLTDLTGQSGNYTANLTRVSRGVDGARCIRCLACMDACPEMVPDAFNDRIGQRKAIYRPLFGNPDALPLIDWAHCTRCGACVKACPTDAIDLDARETSEVLENVCGVIVAGGNTLYDPAGTDLYGYGILPNVVTATAFERLLSGSGPCQGQPVRPSDGKPICRVAWIQCVGSRNVMIGAGHCSSTCCMFAIKAARLAKRKLGADIDATIFYMDMRTYGRDYQRYRDAAETLDGIRFIRCRIHSVETGDDPGDLRLTYIDETGQPIEALFDLVVLSTGAGVQAQLPPFLADKCDQGGVISLGPEVGLMDIHETVLRAHSGVAALLRNLELTLPSDAAMGGVPANQGMAQFQKRPSVQVLLIENPAIETPTFDWSGIESTILGWPGRIDVARYAVDGNGGLSEAVQRTLAETRANRLLIAARHLPACQSALSAAIRENGFSPLLVEWVDLGRSEVVVGPASIDLEAALRPVRVALRRLLNKRPGPDEIRPVQKSALVIGAGPAGLSAAVSLAGQGVTVHLLEKRDHIGGNGPLIQDEHLRRPIEQLITQAKGHPQITIHTSARLGVVSGVPGDYQGWVLTDSGETPIHFGAIILATGGMPANTNAYGLGSHPCLVSHFDFEKKVHDPQLQMDPPRTVVMIQCVGSREEPRNYCSRTCCLKALDNALAVRQRFPDTRILIFYRDIMTEGILEERYAEARRRHIRFVPFDRHRPPRVNMEGDRLIVEGFDPVMGETVQLDADWVSLAIGMDPAPVHDVARLLKVPVTADGFIAEADVKWRPVDTINPGVFVCGLAKGPLRADAALAEGQAAALRVMRLLARDAISAPRKRAWVRHSICSRCHLCIDACPYGARFVDPVSGQVMVDPVGCQGCGTCAAVCPNSATVMGDNTDDTLMDAIEAALE